MSVSITLIGRIAKEPVSRYTPSGTAIFNCDVPVTHYMSKNDFGGKEKPCPEGWHESYNGKGWEYVQWWRVTVFGKRAETCYNYLTKGSWVAFHGRMNGTVADGVMSPTVWEGRDGSAHAGYELVADEVEFLGKNPDSDMPHAEQHQGAPRQDEIDPQNIPF